MSKLNSNHTKWILTVFVAATLIVAGYATVNPKPKKARLDAPQTGIKFERTPARLARGRYLVESVVDCFACHSDMDWKKTGMPRPGTQGGGGLVPDEGFPGKIYAPNISPDPETGAGTWSDEVFERALRQGIGHDGRTLAPFMPYPFFRNLSDEDLASIIVYVRSLKPVRNKVPASQWPEELKATMQPLPPLTEPVPGPDPTDPVKRGAYLVNAAQCMFCHTPVDENFRPMEGLEFGGGQPLIGPWGRVAGANITPDPSGISYYDESIFLKTIKTGRVNGVRPLANIMPWRRFRTMTERDLKDIFAFLQTLKPVAHRVDNTEPPTDCKICGRTHGYGDRNSGLLGAVSATQQ